jgi:hypothetical protein
MNRSLMTLRPYLCLLVLLVLPLAMATPPTLAGGSSSKIAPKGKKELVPITDTSTMKEYNPDAQWRVEPCKHCHGRGYVLVTTFDRKKFNNVTRMRLCYYCKGKGTAGMSRK